MISVYTAAFTDFGQQGTAGLETDVLWCYARLGDSLGAMNDGRGGLR